jgi:hypothetical protein
VMMQNRSTMWRCSPPQVSHVHTTGCPISGSPTGGTASVSQTASPPHPVQRKRKSGGMGLDRGDSDCAPGLPPVIRRVPRLSLCRGTSRLPVYPCPCRGVKVVLDVVRVRARAPATSGDRRADKGDRPTHASGFRGFTDAVGPSENATRTNILAKFPPIFRCKGPGKPLVYNVNQPPRFGNLRTRTVLRGDQATRT